MISVFFLVAGLVQPTLAIRHQLPIAAPDRDTVVVGPGVRFHFASLQSTRLGSPARDMTEVAGLRREGMMSLVIPDLPDSTREQTFEYSDGFYTRLTIHRIASFGIVPLFVLQYIAGEQRLTKGRFAPAWTREAHLPLAVAVGGLFSINTVTGLWNLAESSRDPYGRSRRTIHAATMLLADFGFALTGILAPNITSIEQRLARGDTSWTPHKIVAVSSMGLSLASYLLMLVWN